MGVMGLALGASFALEKTETPREER